MKTNRFGMVTSLPTCTCGVWGERPCILWHMEFFDFDPWSSHLATLFPSAGIGTKFDQFGKRRGTWKPEFFGKQLLNQLVLILFGLDQYIWGPQTGFPKKHPIWALVTRETKWNNTVVCFICFLLFFRGGSGTLKK